MCIYNDISLLTLYLKLLNVFQTKFNEAVNRVSKEKDRVIEELKQKESKVVEEIKKLKGKIKKT